MAVQIPPEMTAVRDAARQALAAIEPAGPAADGEARALMLASRTDGGRDLPPYYLVYFLLVDLLGFQNIGQWEKTAWAVPIRYQGRLYSIEHRKFGVGVFAPTFDANARMSGKPSEQAEDDAREIAILIRIAVRAADEYFHWRAEQAAEGTELNVRNNCDWLYDRYICFRDRFQGLVEEAEERKEERTTERKTLLDGRVVTRETLAWYKLTKEAEWNAQAAVDAFFSWTEHAFIHLAILQGRLRTGADIAKIADANWPTKFRAALDLSDPETKEHYDRLLDLRVQIRNFMAHGAFGKRGEAFRFHSGAGAVPLLLTRQQEHRYSFTGGPKFDEKAAIVQVEGFLEHLWSGSREAAYPYLFSGMPSILSYVADGTYARCMESVEEMREFVDQMIDESDRAANMDW